MDAYIGASGVLTGSARAAQGALEKAAVLASQQEAARRKRELERKRTATERQISGLRTDYETEAMELRRIDEQVGTRTRLLTTEQAASSRLRQADAKVAASARGKPRQGGEIDENQNSETTSSTAPVASQPNSGNCAFT